jgi:alginate O-acetyltransferase complex protein AlgJ
MFVLVFAAILAAPLLQMVFHFAREPVVDERREARSIPAPIARLTALDPHLFDDVNGWFDDRLGFRSVLIRLKNEIDYQIFSTSDKVIIGSHGWLFQRTFVNRIVGNARDPSLSQQALDALMNLQVCLARRGVELVFVLNSTKSSIYPQFLPEKLPVDPPPRQARRLAEELYKNPQILFIDGERILSRHSGEQLFNKIDVHINLIGASYVYREMVTKIAHFIGKQPPDIPPEAWSAVNWSDGSEARFLAKFLPVEDIVYNTPRSNTALSSDNLGTFEYDVGKSELQERPDLPLYDWIFRNKRPEATLLPPMMLFGTSFSDSFFALRYNEFFKTVYRTRSNYPELIGPLLRNLPDDVKIFVLEFPEPLFALMLRLDQPRDCGCGDALCSSDGYHQQH